VLPLNLNAAATNYHDNKVNGDMLKQIPSSANIPITLEVIQSVQQGIKDAFFVPLFQALSQITKQMTVPEVQRRISENMILLGPVVGRFTQDVLDPVIERVMMILYRNNELPAIPEVLLQEDIDVVYISPLAKAQRESEVYSIEAFMNDVAMIAQAKPACLDKINEDNALDILAKVRGIDPSLIRSDGDVKAIREQRAEQQAQMVKAEQLRQGAETVAIGAKATKDMKDADTNKK
jgi:hypothetical protein